MTRRSETIPADYFERLYQQDIDPWRFASSDYEREKYAATIAALPRARYSHALEVGCSIGVLTRQLAKKCDRLLALDASRTALAEARNKCQDLPNIAFGEAVVPADWPEGRFDLVLLSEVVYYLNATDVGKLAARVASTLAAQADVVLVHWTGETDYPLTGDEAADLFISKVQDVMVVTHSARKAEYRLDVLTRR